MSVKVYNDWIVISEDDPSYFPLSIDLRFIEPEHTIRVKGRDITIRSKTNYVYTRKNGSMYIPSGLKNLLLPYLRKSEVYDNTENFNQFNTSNSISNIELYRNVLDGITLRDDQIIAVRKMLFAKRCIIQMSTGAGKTEVMCAFTKVMTDCNNGITPTILLIEPTIRLVDDTVRRFKRYGIPTVKYSDNRKIVDNCVNICHPKSLGNDLEKDINLLESIQIMLGDECHHLRSETFRKPVEYMPNLEYSIGVSASAISQQNSSNNTLNGFTYDELLTIGATGPLVMNITSSSLINNGNLADPVLFLLDNPANEYISSNDIANWHVVSKERLESENRNDLICKASEFFDSVDRKVLILVRTKRHAQALMKKLSDEYGLRDRTRSSFGGGLFEKYNGCEFIPDDSDVFEKYNSGEYSILIGTSHLYEGVDIPNLDVIILAIGGKGERLQIQGVGRVLRKTKSGKYAWIIDFNDSEDVILSKHSRLRLERYKNIIGIPDEHIFSDMDIDNLEMIFNELERC